MRKWETRDRNRMTYGIVSIGDPFNRKDSLRYNSLPYKDSPTPKLAAKRSANFLQIHFRFTSDSLQIQFGFNSDGALSTR
ncbi:hypothetical protein VN97_g11205 [Penicillium thymicola]|uniref:Uncharacterized protein n=1 Tax=Penicillium thymicola TaxID=293382 RepID=A0AAI9T936_PENTH|nr:hypothetical protein VN97_g11205 [Penicillium thymicola]